MKIVDLGKYKKIRIAFNQTAELEMKDYKTRNLEFTANSQSITQSKFILGEISLPRHASCYALLGLEFIPHSKEKLLIEIRVNEGSKKYGNSMSLHSDCSYIGMPEEYVQAITDGTQEFINLCDSVPCGKIILKEAAHCEVGSSYKIFNLLIKILLKMLFEKTAEISDDEIYNICEYYLIKDEFIKV